MSQSTWWNSLKGGSKKGFDGAWKALDKLGAPVNKLTNKLGSEAFWPTTLDKESDKAARILKSFCKDGFYSEEERAPEDGPKQKQKVIKKIPASVIKNAKGLAIFTTMRSGLWVSGAGGSGVVVARLPDGSWSPPSGILLHTAGLGFLVGVDIYDCVVVINSEKALEAFTKLRCTLGSEISVVAGPVGVGGILDTELHKRQAPIFTYMKSRGFYAGVQIDGTIVVERYDENERFYLQKLTAQEILTGKVRHPPFELKRLFETIKAAQGDTNFDASVIPDEPPPGDYEVDDGHIFGVPDPDDTDPYGVMALEKEGMGVKEAGTQRPASWEQFSFNPSPTSPIHALRHSQDMSTRTVSRRSSWRTSAFSQTAEPKTPSSLRNSMEQPMPPPRPVVMTDTATQTDFEPEAPSPTRWSARDSLSRRSTDSRSSLVVGRPISMPDVPENEVLDTSPDRTGPEHVATANGYTTPPHTPTLDGVNEEDQDEDVHVEEPIVHSIQTVQPVSPQVISKARLVQVPKRGPPPVLPPRNPQRNGPLVIDASPKTGTPEDSETASMTKAASPEPSTVEGAEADIAGHESLDGVEDKMNEVRLDDDEDEEEPMRNPWAKVEETRNRQSQDSSRIMPGGFD